MRLRPTGPMFVFTLRGLFVITTLVAIGVALVGVKVKRARDEKVVAAELMQLGASLQYAIGGVEGSPLPEHRTWFERWLDLDLEWHVAKVTLPERTISETSLNLAAQLPYLEKIGWWGQHRFSAEQLQALGRLRTQNPQKLDYADPATDALVAAAAKVPHLELLRLKTDPLVPTQPDLGDWTPMGLAPLSEALYLKELYLTGRGFTDDHLQNLAALPQLKSLLISDTAVSGLGLIAILKAAPRLERLYIANSAIGGSALAFLKACPNFLEIWISECDLTENEIATIEKRLFTRLTLKRARQNLQVLPGP